MRARGSGSGPTQEESKARCVWGGWVRGQPRACPPIIPPFPGKQIALAQILSVLFLNGGVRGEPRPLPSAPSVRDQSLFLRSPVHHELQLERPAGSHC